MYCNSAKFILASTNFISQPLLIDNTIKWIIYFQFQAIIHDLTEKCWDTCIDRPGPKMDGKSENCLKNCVQRFLDTNIAVTQNLEAKATNILNNHDNL